MELVLYFDFLIFREERSRDVVLAGFAMSRSL